MKFENAEPTASRKTSSEEAISLHGPESSIASGISAHEKLEAAGSPIIRIESAQSELGKMIADGLRRVRTVERDVGLSEKDIAEIRAEVGFVGHSERIRSKASALFDGFKERLLGLMATKGSADPQAAQRETRMGQEYRGVKEYLKYEQREISAPVIREARRKRDQLLEARGLCTMSRAEFDSFFAFEDFSIRSDLSQQNVGDCYAVAAIHAMSRSPHFEIICRTSMRRNPDGSWQVKVPLMSDSGRTITITPEELLPQRNRQFLRRKETGGIMPDLRMKLLPAKGKEGLQVLEAAFIKAKFGTVDRLAAEGGLGDEALLLLGGENFVQYSLNSATYDEAKQRWEYPGLSSLSEEDMAYLDHYLENFDPEIHIATASTKGGGTSATGGFYKGEGTNESFVRGHAYSISNVDPGHRKITLANPWDTSKPIELTFEQFKQNFSGLGAIRIDSATLLGNMRRIEKRAS